MLKWILHGIIFGILLTNISFIACDNMVFSSYTRCSDAYSDTMLGYANSIRTVDGGTHIDGTKASLTRTLNSLGKKSKIIKVHPFLISVRSFQ